MLDVELIKSLLLMNSLLLTNFMTSLNKQKNFLNLLKRLIYLIKTRINLNCLMMVRTLNISQEMVIGLQVMFLMHSL